MITQQQHVQSSKRALLRELSLEQQQEFLDSLSENELVSLASDWDYWGRPDQQIPEELLSGDKTIWLPLAGRGWGKTRTGAEFVRTLINRGYGRIALIGPTAADTRDVMVEGESGLLNIFPDHERPIYESSKRLVTFSNGAQAHLYSAEEPERLRGPQHDAGWCDEICLVANTQITTDSGFKNIQDMQVGERVKTRKGFQTILKAWQTSESADVYELTLSNGSTLRGTPNHPVYVHGEGFVPMHSIVHGKTLLYDYGYFREHPWIAWIASDTLTNFGICKKAITRTGAGNFCIGESGKIFTRKALRGFISTIKIMIPPIIPLRILSALLTRSTQKSIYTALQLCQMLTAARMPLVSGSADEKPLLTVNVLSAGRFINPLECGQSSATLTADQPITVKSVRRLQNKHAVYNLEVANTHEFFANGILTHNCAWKNQQDTWDMYEFGARLGAHPLTIVTTTPKPTKFLKELIADHETHVTKGRTLDNAVNLSDKFIARIKRKYEGTRLGRQELNAEILDDNPNALFTRKHIEDGRVQKAPELVRIVVAIDPAVTNTEGSDATGIVACGIDANNRGYVLDDSTLKDDVSVWAQVAVGVFDDMEADLIVGEANNGGDLIENVIRQAEKAATRVKKSPIAYNKVTATRGKAIRAEFLTLLYEQGKIHHVGTYPDLEDEMCDFDPTLVNQDSPNRLDALVWAFTELFNKKTREVRVMVI